MKSKTKHFFFFVCLTFLFSAKQVLAVCPVCTIAVGAGVGLCRWLGIDDLISGVWIGGLIISMILWLLDWLEKKQIRFRFKAFIVSVFFYLVILLPLHWTGIIGHPLNTFHGIDKLLFGIILGSLAFSISVLTNIFLKKKNNGQVYFPYQKVVLPVIFLMITSLIIYHFITC